MNSFAATTNIHRNEHRKEQQTNIKMAKKNKSRTEKPPPIDQLIKPAVGVVFAFVAYYFMKGINTDVSLVSPLQCYDNVIGYLGLGPCHCSIVLVVYFIFLTEINVAYVYFNSIRPACTHCNPRSKELM